MHCVVRWGLSHRWAGKKKTKGGGGRPGVNLCIIRQCRNREEDGDYGNAFTTKWSTLSLPCHVKALDCLLLTETVFRFRLWSRFYLDRTQLHYCKAQRTSSLTVVPYETSWNIQTPTNVWHKAIEQTANPQYNLLWHVAEKSIINYQ